MFQKASLSLATHLVIVVCLGPLIAGSYATTYHEATSTEQDPQLALLKRACQREKSGNVLLTLGPHEVRQLVNEQRQQQVAEKSVCDTAFDESIRELGKLLEPDQLADVCSTQMYKLVRAYHKKYIHFYLPETTRERMIEQKVEFERTGGGQSRIPAAFRNFFVLFVKQINAMCKQHLVSEMQRLEASSKKLLDEEDFAVIEQYKSEQRHIGFLGPFSPRVREVAFSELEMFNLTRLDLSSSNSAAENAAEGARLYLQVRFDDHIKRLKVACEQRFMPIYTELFAPVIKLNNLAYIDRLNSDRGSAVAREPVYKALVCHNSGLRGFARHRSFARLERHLGHG